MEVALISFGVGALIFLAYFFSEIFKEFQIPDVLFLVAIGIVIGPITGLVDVSDVGVVGELFVIFTLLIILFEAGLGIKLRGLFSTASRATTFMLGTLVTTVAVVLPITYFLFGFTLIDALLVSVILGGLSGGIVVPILEKLSVSDTTKSLLTFEANINDVFTIGVIFAIIDFGKNGFFNLADLSVGLGANIFIALVVGALTGIIWSQIISRVRGIQNNIFMTPALVLVVFGVTELLGANGVFAALAFGITLGNLQFVRLGRLPLLLGFQEFKLTKWENRMFSGFVFLLKTYFFVFIGLSIGFEDFLVLVVALAVTAILFVMRMIVVKLFASREISPFDIEVLYRLLPKGLVGAALITLIDNTVARDFTYGVILWSIVLTSLFIFLLPKNKGYTEGRESTIPTQDPTKSSPRTEQGDTTVPFQQKT